MKRYLVGSILLALVASVVAAGVLLRPTDDGGDAVETTSPTDDSPNIVVFMADDIRADDIAHMTTVKRKIRSKGTQFMDAVPATTPCCPSRASFLTGQYVHNHGVLTNEYDTQGGHRRFFETGAESRSFVIQLQQLGYRSALVGKYMNQYPDLAVVSQDYIPPGWDEWYAFTVGGEERQTFYYDYEMNENGDLVSYGDDPQSYSTDVITTRANGVIRDAAREGEPLFLFVSYYAPHNPGTPAPRHEGEGGTRRHNPNYNEADVSDKPEYIRASEQIPRRGRDRIGVLNGTKIRRFRDDRTKALHGVDESIGSIIDTLRREGLLDNTYLIFTSDSGVMYGEHRLWTIKSFPYEESINVPLMIRGPGVGTRTVDDFPVSLVDLAPTILTWAGASASQLTHMDGIPLDGVLTGDVSGGELGREFVLVSISQDFEKAAYNSDVAMPAWDLLRGDRFVYVEYVNGEKELYDLHEDPYQLTNLAYEAAHRSELEEFGEILTRAVTCEGPSCRRLASSG